MRYSLPRAIEGPRLYPLANSQVSHSLTDVGRRLLGQKQNSLSLTVTEQAASVLHLHWCLWSTQGDNVGWGASRKCGAHRGFASHLMESKLRKPKPFKTGINLPEGEIIFIGGKNTCHLLLTPGGDTVCFFQCCLLYENPLRQDLEQRLSVPLLTRLAGMQETSQRTVPPHSQTAETESPTLPG